MGYLCQTGTCPDNSLTPDPGDFLTFFSSLLAGLLPLSEALGSVEKHHLSLGRSCLGSGGGGWDGYAPLNPG